MEVDDALSAAHAGADAVGMILYAPGSKRIIDPNRARDIATKLPPFVSGIGVVKDCSNNRIRQLMAHLPLSALQFHGRESVQDLRSAQPTRAIKMLKADDSLAEKAAEWNKAIVPNLVAILVDSAEGGGSGVETDWSRVESLDRANLPPMILAGGLTPENVGDVVRRLRPWAVDVSSGVEADQIGRKSHARIVEFIQAVREADASQTR